VVVAMIAMRMMQVAIHQIVQMITVGNLGVSTGRSMAVVLLMASASVLGAAGRRIGPIDFQNVVINMVAMNVVQVAIMQIIRVAVVLDGDMAALRAMFVGVPFMHFAGLLFHVPTPQLGNVTQPTPFHGLIYDP
jgi:hypothetical protein